MAIYDRKSEFFDKNTHKIVNNCPRDLKLGFHLLKDLLRDRFNSKCLLSLDELNQIIVDICVN